MYFNLKEDVAEADMLERSKRFFAYLQEKIEGFGPVKILRHHGFGVAFGLGLYRTFERFETYSIWDEYDRLLKDDPQAAKLGKDFFDLVDLKSHIDEFVREL